MSSILDGTNGLSDVDGTAAAPALRGTDANTGIFFPAADTIAFAEGGAEVMRIDSAGDVGIGTTSPSYKLHVVNAAGGDTIVLDNGGGAGDGASTYLAFSGTNTGANFVRGRIRGAFPDATGGGLAFETGTSGSMSERARIDTNGNFGVGRNPNGYGRIAISFSATDSNNNSTGLGIDVQAATSGAKYVQFYNESGSGIGHINRNGTTNAVQYTTSSDYRLKENIQPMQGALSLISQLKPCTYDWKQECGGGVGQGFIAHELQAVVPDCVSGEKDAVETYTDEDGNAAIRPVYQGIDTSYLVATLTAAIQELKAIVDTQAARITALEAA